MKLISWNVNGLRACVNKGLMDFFKEADADIFCVQETKMRKEQADFTFDGYREYWYSAEKKGYSGTAVFTKAEPLAVTYGLTVGLPDGADVPDNEGRIITLEYKDFFVVNVYAPNSQYELSRLNYRMAWEDAARARILDLDRQKTVFVCGDFNVAHKEIDLKHPKTNRRNAGFTDEERGKLTELLDAGFTDTYRHLYPDAGGAYTWWTYTTLTARENNTGWRIDYILVSERDKARIKEAFVYQQIYGSDHCPVGLVFQ